MTKASSKLIGSSPIRKEGVSKVTGRAKYVDDIGFDNLIYGTTVRSSIARGKIRKIEYGPGIPWNEIVTVTAKDIPGGNYVALLEKDQPYLADGQVNHPEEPIILLAHADKYMLERAREAVRIAYDPLPANFSIDDSTQCFKEILIDKGNVDTVWDKADHVIEGEYFTGAQEQLYIENNGVIAVANPVDGVTVWGSLQCPYYVHKALKALFNLPDEKIRVIQTETGGGFGGKEDYPSVIAGHAALLAWKANRPVKLVYDRAEDMAATTKRHPSRTRHRTAVSKDGKLLAMEIDFVLDGGAYMTLSPVVLSRGAIHAAGPYRCDHVRVKARAMATNCPPHGAFRGFGAPQSLFAVERHLDEIAHRIGLNEESIRRYNFLKKGDTTATGQVIREEVDLDGLMTEALRVSNYRQKQKRFARENPKSAVKRGMGLASFLHGAGFTGSGEKMLASIVAVEATMAGKIQVQTSNTEIGQGTNTIFSQIAADALSLEYDDIDVLQPDTRAVPNSGPTVASRTTMIVGKLVETAALSLKSTLIDSGLLAAKHSRKEFLAACRTYLKKFGKLRVQSQYQQPPGINWDDNAYRGEAYGTYAWAVYVAQVALDTLTFETTVENFWTVQEVGRVIHPKLAEGQIIGGVAQGIGYALYEKVVWKDGRMANNKMTNYIMPTSMDAPPIHVIFKEQPYAHGPAGAKGIGELPMDGPGPAILNALENATGISFNEIPLLPEQIFQQLEKTDAG